jgi:hypothetical protein
VCPKSGKPTDQHLDVHHLEPSLFNDLHHLGPEFIKTSCLDLVFSRSELEYNPLDDATPWFTTATGPLMVAHHPTCVYEPASGELIKGWFANTARPPHWQQCGSFLVDGTGREATKPSLAPSAASPSLIRAPCIAYCPVMHVLEVT